MNNIVGGVRKERKRERDGGGVGNKRLGICTIRVCVYINTHARTCNMYTNAERKKETTAYIYYIGTPVVVGRFRVSQGVTKEDATASLTTLHALVK